jgi:stage IV sporulation protein FB
MRIQLEPGRTAYDWQFRVAGIPVRVHPFFWLASLILGFGSGDPEAIVVWIVAVFVSILLHELGHAWAMRQFGSSAHIVLYHFGGLAVEESAQYEWMPTNERTTRESIIVALAGPLAGFVFATVIALLLVASGGHFGFHAPRFPDIAFWSFRFPAAIAETKEVIGATGGTSIRVTPLFLLCHDLFYINIFWGLVNLLPIYPLDGGQIAKDILTERNRFGGLAQALQLSCVVAAVAGVFAFLILQDRFIAFFFLILGVNNYYLWQQVRRAF